MHVQNMTVHPSMGAPSSGGMQRIFKRAAQTTDVQQQAQQQANQQAAQQAQQSTVTPTAYLDTYTPSMPAWPLLVGGLGVVSLGYWWMHRR